MTKENDDNQTQPPISPIEHPEQFTELLRRYTRVAMYQLSAPVQFEDDIAQESWRKLLNAHHLGGLPDHSKPQAWRKYVFQAVRNVAIDQLKARARGPTVNLADVDAPARPVKEDFKDELQAVFDAAVTRLTPREYEVLQLRVVIGIMNKNVAELLHVSPQQVSELEERARTKIVEFIKSSGAKNPAVSRLMARMASSSGSSTRK